MVQGSTVYIVPLWIEGETTTLGVILTSFMSKIRVHFFLKINYCFDSFCMYIKPATDDSQNSHKHISWLSSEKNVHIQELPTQILQFVLLSCAIVSKVISSTSSQENPFVFCKIAASTAKQHEAWNMRNLFCDVTWKKTRNLYTCFVFCVFSCYKCISWPLWLAIHSLVILHVGAHEQKSNL